jgi:hypothetical protein
MSSVSIRIREAALGAAEAVGEGGGEPELDGVGLDEPLGVGRPAVAADDGEATPDGDGASFGWPPIDVAEAVGAVASRSPCMAATSHSRATVARKTPMAISSADASRPRLKRGVPMND